MKPGSTTSPSTSPWRAAMNRFRQKRSAMVAMRILQGMAIVALLADFIAYGKPLTAVYKGTRYFPVVADYLSAVGLYQWDADLIHAKWADLPLEQAVWPPVRYFPNQLDTRHDKVSPFAAQEVPSFMARHHLGTMNNGFDVASILIHGIRISLSIGLVAMGIATFIGILIGATAGYFGDQKVRITRAALLMLVVSLPFAYFYGFQVRIYVLRDTLAQAPGWLLPQLLLSLLIAGVVMGAFYLLARPLSRIPGLGAKTFLPVDMTLSRLLDIIHAIPILLLLITLLLVNKQGGIYLTMTLIGLLGWAGIAQYMRAEMLRVRNLEYIQAAQSLGYSDLRILLRHALPNSLSTILIIVAFGVAGAIALEAGLSFLGIGIPETTMTWGKVISSGRTDLRAWWLTVFPSIMIFTTILCLNLIGQGLRDALDPRQRRM